MKNSAVQERFHDPRSVRPEPGATVHALDGTLLGEVTDVNGIYFKVVPNTKHSFWLSTDQILSCSDGDVTLALTSDGLDAYRLSRPGGEAWEPPLLDALEDTLLTESDQRRQREQMEEELREQRANLPRA